LARSFGAWRSYQTAKRSKRTVPAHVLFDIKQGVRLGNDVFVVSREFVSSLSTNERRFFRPAIMNPSIDDGKVHDRYYVFYPHSEGVPALSSEEQLQQHLPRYFNELLLPAKQTLLRRRSIGREGLNWWDLDRPRTWQQAHAPKIVSKYFGGKRSFAYDKAGNFVVVVGHAWLRQLGTSDIGLTDEEMYLAILTYLNSGVADALREYVSVQISSGQVDLSNKYMKDLPIIDLAKVSPYAISRLVAMGSQINEGNVNRWTDVDDAVLAALGE